MKISRSGFGGGRSGCRRSCRGGGRGGGRHLFVLRNGVCLLRKGVQLGNFVLEQLVDHAMTFERVQALKGIRDNDHVVGLSTAARYVRDHLQGEVQSKQSDRQRISTLGARVISEFANGRYLPMWRHSAPFAGWHSRALAMRPSLPVCPLLAWTCPRACVLEAEERRGSVNVRAGPSTRWCIDCKLRSDAN